MRKNKCFFFVDCCFNSKLKWISTICIVCLWVQRNSFLCLFSLLCFSIMHFNDCIVSVEWWKLSNYVLYFLWCVELKIKESNQSWTKTKSFTFIEKMLTSLIQKKQRTDDKDTLSACIIYNFILLIFSCESNKHKNEAFVTETFAELH